MNIMPARVPFSFASQANSRCSTKEKKRSIFKVLAVHKGERGAV